jgi:hypothetical protein
MDKVLIIKLQLQILIQSRLFSKETVQKYGQGSVMTYEATAVELPLIIGL